MCFFLGVATGIAISFIAVTIKIVFFNAEENEDQINNG